METPKPQPNLEIIPSPWLKWFKADIKKIKGELTSLKASQAKIKRTLVDLKGVCEELAQYASSAIVLFLI